MNLAERPNAEEKSVQWRDIGDLDTSIDFLYPENSMEERPVPKSDHLETEQQQLYMRWIEKILDLDRRTTKDPRLHCAYCDMNNHPRFSGKHVYKHQNPDARHRCTLCAGCHPPFLCSSAQMNGGKGKPNWYKIEYKCAKQDGREPDYRWGGGCPTIAENQEWKPPVPTQHVIWPNPGFKIEANLWNLIIPDSARRPGPLAYFLRHCNIMESPYILSYGKSGSQPVDDIVWLDRSASTENLRELQIEATCCRQWSNDILDQIMDEQEKVQTWISGMTDELIRLRRVQPAWIQQMQQAGPPPVPQASMAASSIQQHQPASSSAAFTVPVKPAPMSRNPSMASAPKHVPFPSGKGADPWAEALQKKQNHW